MRAPVQFYEKMKAKNGTVDADVSVMERCSNGQE